VTDSVGHEHESLSARHDAEGSDIVTGVAVRERSVAAHVPEYTSDPRPGGPTDPLPVDTSNRKPLVKGTTLETTAEEGDELAQARQEVAQLRAKVKDLQHRLTAIGAVIAGAQAS
jgi:uncharacterized protein YkwD